MTKTDITTVTRESRRVPAPPGGTRNACRTTAPIRRTDRTGVTVCSAGPSAAQLGRRAFNPQLGYLFVNTSSLATIGRMVPGAGLEKYRNRLILHAILGRQEVSVSAAALGRARRRQCDTGDIAWKVRLGIYPELVAKGFPDRHSNLGGPIANRKRPGVHRRHQRCPVPRLRRQDRKELWYAHSRAAAGPHRSRHGRQRHAVCRHRCRRAG